jgi:hypothetical protein
MNRWAIIPLALLSLFGCSENESAAPIQGGNSSEGGSGGVVSQGGSGATGGSGGSGGTPDPGPNVDTTDPQLYEAQFSADEADDNADEVLGTQLAFLDTSVPIQGKLVVYLHGAGLPSTCGSNAHGTMLASLGFHVFSPCYHSGYGVGNCNDDIEGCRLEAFEGVDHHAFIDVSPANSTETRIVRGLAHLQTLIPQGDWSYFVQNGSPRWDKIIISGISHGASSSGVVALHRNVSRAVMLSGPLDSGQAWLMKTPLTPVASLWALSHTDDSQHPGHLQAFDDMGLVGQPTSVDGAMPPYGGSHRLISSAATNNGHGAVQAGSVSPQDGNGDWTYLPVWTTLYTQ